MGSEVPSVLVIGVSIVLIIVFTIMLRYLGTDDWTEFANSILSSMIAGLLVGVMLIILPLMVRKVQDKTPL